jgi:hypothetical protein
MAKPDTLSMVTRIVGSASASCAVNNLRRGDCRSPSNPPYSRSMPIVVPCPYRKSTHWRSRAWLGGAIRHEVSWKPWRVLLAASFGLSLE